MIDDIFTLKQLNFINGEYTSAAKVGGIVVPAAFRAAISLSRRSLTIRINSRRYTALNAAMMPWSLGCMSAVVFGGNAISVVN